MKPLLFATLMLLPSSIFANSIHVDIATATWYSNTGACAGGGILTACPIATFSASYDMDVVFTTTAGPFPQRLETGVLAQDSMQFVATGMLSGIQSFSQYGNVGSMLWFGGQEGLLNMFPNDWWGLPGLNLLEPGVFSKSLLELRCNPCADHIVGGGRESLYWNPGSGGTITVTAVPAAQVPEAGSALLLTLGLGAIGALRRRRA